jgi:hypothetical protein
MLKKSSPLKLLGQMEPTLAGSIYVRSSIKFLHLVPFGQQTWPLLLKIKKNYRGPYIDAFCQVWFHLAQLFQRSRLKYEKVNGRTTDAKWWQYLTWPFESYRPYLNDNIGVLFTDSPFYLWMGMMEINFSITHILF